MLQGVEALVGMTCTCGDPKQKHVGGKGSCFAVKEFITSKTLLTAGVVYEHHCTCKRFKKKLAS